MRVREVSDARRGGEASCERCMRAGEGGRATISGKFNSPVTLLHAMFELIPPMHPHMSWGVRLVGYSGVVLGHILATV